MDEDEDFAEAYNEAIAVDLKNLDDAMNRLIDSVSRFKSVSTIEDLNQEEFAQMLANLDYAKFIVSGVMYLHGMPICGHDHSEDEDEDDEG